VSLWRRIYLERRAVILPLFILLAANVAMLALAVLPLTGNVSSLHADAQNATTALLKARLVDKQAKDARASKDRADQELRKFYVEILPANATAARKLVSFLERTAGESGLQFQRSQLEQSDVKDSQLERMSGKVTLVGDYQNIRKFLYAVETAQQFVVIERVGLSQAADLRSANSGRLEVTLDIATYYVGGPTSVPSQ
jgi:Tfp pilus assembly protein PilO